VGNTQHKRLSTADIITTAAVVISRHVSIRTISNARPVDGVCEAQLSITSPQHTAVEHPGQRI